MFVALPKARTGQPHVNGELKFGIRRREALLHAERCRTERQVTGCSRRFESYNEVICGMRRVGDVCSRSRYRYHNLSA